MVLVRQNKQVTVRLEFPQQSDQKAEQEFIENLKAIYFERLKDGALTYPAVLDKGERGDV